MTRYHATVDGNIPFTPEEEAAREAEIVEWNAGEAKRGALRQIVALEAKITSRMHREVILGKTDVNPETGKTAKQDIDAIDAQIAALRAQL